MLKPNQKAVLLEECSPFVVQQRAIGLKIVLDALMGLFVFLLQRDHLLKEFESEQRRLAALPGKDHFAAVLSFDVLPDVRFQDFVGDAEFLLGAEQFLLVQGSSNRCSRDCRSRQSA